MPAKDKFHDAVKHALVKDGWTVTHDPLKLNFGFTVAYVDLGAEKLRLPKREQSRLRLKSKVLSAHLSYMSFTL